MLEEFFMSCHLSLTNVASHLIADALSKKWIFVKNRNVVCKMCCKMNTKFSHSNTWAIKHIMTKTVANDDNILIKFSDDNDSAWGSCFAMWRVADQFKILQVREFFGLHKNKLRERGIKLHVNNLISELWCATAAANDISNWWFFSLSLTSYLSKTQHGSCKPLVNSFLSTCKSSHGTRRWVDMKSDVDVKRKTPAHFNIH